MSTYREQVYSMLGAKQEPQSDFKKEVYGMLGVKPTVTNWYQPSASPQKADIPAKQTENHDRLNDLANRSAKPTVQFPSGLGTPKTATPQDWKDIFVGDEEKAREVAFSVLQDETLKDTLKRGALQKMQDSAGHAALAGAHQSYANLLKPLTAKYGNENFQTMEELAQAGQQAHPIAYGAGYAGGKMSQYAGGAQLMQSLPFVGKATGALGAKIGAGVANLTGGKIAAEIAAPVASSLLADTLLDVALDTAPEAIGNISDGKSAGEVAKSAAKNVAVNVGFNMGAEAVGQLFKAIKAGKATKEAAEQAKKALDGMDDAAKQAVAVEYGLKDADELVQEIENAVKVKPQKVAAGNIPPDASVGAATSGFDPYSKAANQYGTIKPGENPARVVDVPLSMDGKTKVQQFARTAMEAKATPDEMIPEFEKKVAEGLFSYNPKKDAPALDAAIKSITDKGYKGALEQWDDIAQGRRVASKDDMVLGQMLYSLAAKNGDSEMAMKLAAEIAAEGTRMGQGIQAMRMLKKTTPEGKLYYVQKSADNIKQELIKKYGKNAPKIEIDNKLVENYMDAIKTGEQSAMDTALGAIEQNIADQLPVTFMDKWNAWRYFAMLGNPRTHIRNVVGNGLFGITTKIKNGLAAAIEDGVDAARKSSGKEGIQRTKTLFKDASAVEFAKNDVLKMQDVLQGGGKYNPADAIKDKRKIFGDGNLEKTRRFAMDMLEREDWWALKPHYTDSLAGYISANKIDPAKITASQLETARSYAVKEAQRATFRDASALANGLNEISRQGPVKHVLVEGMVPFKKTPVNIAKRAVEYSPIGLMNGTKQALLDVKSGKKTAAEAIDTIASGLTGSGIMAIGWWMAQSGVLTAGRDDDAKQQGFDELQGEQNYALKIGDKSYTLDWAAPSAIPLFMGAEFYNRKQGEMSMQEFVNSLLRVGDPLVEMSMLQGLESTLKTAAYSQNVIADTIANTVAGYASQGVPTLAGQVARTVDDTRRTTYVEKGDIKVVSSTLQKAMAKTPGLSHNLTPRIDAWGQEVKQQGDSVLSRAAQNMLSPGYYSESKKTPLDEELERLYKEGVEDSPYPKLADRYFNVGGERIDLTAEQWETYAKEKGQKSREYVDALVRSPYYRKLDDDAKAKVINDLYGYSNALAKTKVSDYKLDAVNLKMYQAEQKGVNPYRYLLIKQSADIDGNGSVSQEEMQRTLDGEKLTREQKAYLYALQNKTWKSNPYR